MPTVKKNLSAMKRVRQAEKRTERNRAAKSRIKTVVKHLEKSMTEGNAEEITKRLRAAIGTINRAASKGILHKNTASRNVSRLTRRVNNALAATSA